MSFKFSYFSHTLFFKIFIQEFLVQRNTSELEKAESKWKVLDLSLKHNAICPYLK